MKWLRVLEQIRGLADRNSIFSTVSLFLTGLCTLVVPLLYFVAIDEVVLGGKHGTLPILLAGLAAASVFDLGISHLRDRITAKLLAGQKHTLYRGVFEKYLSIPATAANRANQPRPATYIGDLDRVSSYPVVERAQFHADAALLVVYGLILTWLSPILAAATAAFVGLHFFLIAWNRRREQEIQRKWASEGNHYAAHVAELVTQFEAIRVNHVGGKIAARLSREADAVIESARARHVRAGASENLVTFLSRVNVVVILWGACQLIFTDGITLGALVAFNFIFYRLSSPMARVVRFGTLEAMRAGAKQRLNKLEALVDTCILDREDAEEIADGSLNITSVSFAYAGQGARALNEVSAVIANGTIVAIRGASGSGKTTLIRLLSRILPLTNGDVMFGGQSIRVLSEPTFRRHVSVVLQSDLMFRATLQENLTLFEPTIDVDEMERLCKEVGAHEFIMANTKGYAAVVGEDRSFSLGQQRRLALVRALLRKPKVLLLDEPTAGLDVEAERRFAQILVGLKGRMTVVIATHSPLIAAHCDRVIDLDHGRIAAPITNAPVVPFASSAEAARVA